MIFQAIIFLDFVLLLFTINHLCVLWFGCGYGNLTTFVMCSAITVISSFLFLPQHYFASMYSPSQRCTLRLSWMTVIPLFGMQWKNLPQQWYSWPTASFLFGLLVVLLVSTYILQEPTRSISLSCFDYICLWILFPFCNICPSLTFFSSKFGQHQS